MGKMKEQAFEQGFFRSSLAFRFEPDGPDYFVIDSRVMRELVEYIEKENNI